METKTLPDLVKSIYIPPEILWVGEVEIEIKHPLLAASIIPDNHEVVIDKQDKGVEEDFTFTGWD